MFIDLTPDELNRYSRHIVLPGVGVEGQRKLKSARILLVGAGGLGSPAALYLAAAGIGHLGIVDFDTVDATNLQRQILHSDEDVGTSKLASAAKRIHSLNPAIDVIPHAVKLSRVNAMEVIGAYDLVIDGTDNFPTRYLVNDACVILGKPNVYGSIFRFEGQASFFDARSGPCYRCLYPQPPPPGTVPDCEEGGVFGVLPGVIGTIQATEAIKAILGIGELLIGRLLLFDALSLRFREVKVAKQKECPVCGDDPSIREPIDYDQFCGTNSRKEGSLNMETDITVEELSERLGKDAELVVIDVREPHEHEINRIPGATLIPLGQIPNRFDEIDRNKEVVVHCRSGGRSARASAFLRSQGFPLVRNLAGGVNAWVDRIDPSQKKY